MTAPPSTGPAITAIPVIPPKIPSAVPRRSGGNAAERSDRLIGATIAAPTPWIVRAAISQPTLGESAQPIDASTNSAIPPAYIVRRPIRSPITDAVISSTAKLSP